MSYLVLQLFFGNAFVADDFLQLFDDNGVITQFFLTFMLLATHLAPPLFIHAHNCRHHTTATTSSGLCAVKLCHSGLKITVVIYL